MIVERVADTLIMATIIVVIISGNGFIEITLHIPGEPAQPCAPR
jgi:hypothetical protein